MRRGLPFFCAFLALLAAAPALAGGNLKLGFSGTPPEKMKTLRIEVLEANGRKAKVAYRDGVAKIAAEGIELQPGNYHVYLEDRETGLIVRVDNHGAGFKVKDRGQVNVDVADFGAQVKIVKDRDRAERRSLAERNGTRPLKTRKKSSGSPDAPSSQEASPVADVPEGSEDEEHVPGELLLKFLPDTTLADRYDVISELSAENRSKIDQLDVYRIRVSDAADLQSLIAQFADDPRIKYMEMNMTVSVPEPVMQEDGK